MNGLRMRSRKKLKFLETNKNDHTTVQNLWDTVKAVLRENFIVIQAYLKNIETFQINSLTLQLQKLAEQQQTKSRARRRKKIIKIRAELKEIVTKRTINKSNN